MTELKCPKCGEDEEIYHFFDGERYGIKCENEKCGYEVRGCESVEEAEFKWKSENDPKALRSCPFCGSINITRRSDNGNYVLCNKCHAEVHDHQGTDKDVEIWNRRVK